MRTNSLPLLGLLLSLTFLFLTKPSHQQSPNPRLFNAFIALQAWKNAITDDPNELTSNWHGPDVCNYTGVYCAPAPDDPHTVTVAGIDLNRARISGSLPDELGLLTDLALLHLNSNRFKGTIPESINLLRLLYELDLSNNRFSGEFPSVVLCLPSLKFLDLRFNKFHGKVPKDLFDKKLDALFINNNNFKFNLPENLGNSTVSVLVLANNKIGGCLPPGIGRMAKTLNEIILMNSSLKSCFPDEIGLLKEVTVFDVSSNGLVGSLPESMGKMKSLEQLNVADNRLSGEVPASICALPKLENFTYSGNYFCGDPDLCLKLKDRDDSENCIPYRPKQRSAQECRDFYSRPVDCGSFGCLAAAPPRSPSSPVPPSYYHKP